MKKFSLNFKIGFVLAVATCGSIAISYVGILNMNILNMSISNLVKVTTPRVKNSYKALSAFRLLAISQANVIMAPDKEKAQAAVNTFKERHDTFIKDLDGWKSIASEEGRKRWAGIEEGYEKWHSKAVLGQKAVLEGKSELAAVMFAEMADIRRAAEGKIEELIEFNDKNLEAEDKRTDEVYASSRNMVFAVSFASILFSVLLAIVIMRAASKAIEAVIRTLSEGSLQVSSAAQQIAASSEQISQAAVEQAASLEETAASIEELNSMVAKNSENADSTANTSGTSQKKATEGKQVVEKMIESMDHINNSNSTIMKQMNDSNDKIAEIVKVIEEIGSKTKVINDIVFQTKLLSFNASVEAARAGEHGKGFAVVAEEVGNLAQMSGNAAKEISTLLDSSVQRVNSIVLETRAKVEQLVNEGKMTVEQGARVARQCGEVLEEIVVNVSSVSSMAGEIATASQEQSRGVNEITKAMNQLDQMTQQNSATSEECASAAEELSAQSESLKNAVAQLVMTIQGGDPASVQAATATNKVRTVPAYKPASANVVHMKPAKPSAPAPSLKKAAGETPAYDDKGFEDI